MEPIIKVENLKYSYSHEGEEVFALDGVDFAIEKGSFVSFLGHNGSGKSTLAKHFNGILLPCGGTVSVLAMDTHDEDKIIQIRRNVGMVFQNPDNQIVASIVEDDVAFAPENLGVESSEIRKRVDKALKAVGMYEYKNHSSHLLSGGQKQRVAIASVIAMEPVCIVLDEPTAMLDPRGRREVLETVQRLCHENGITIILITHHMEETINSDKIFVMNKGKIAYSGTPSEVFSNIDGLKEIGLTVPTPVELYYQLKNEGMDLGNLPLDTEEFALRVKEYFQK